MLDLLVDYGIVITLDEIDQIVDSFVKGGFEQNWNIHKYIRYLNFVHVYKIPVEIWTEYMKQVLINTYKNLSYNIADVQNITSDVTYIINNMVEIYKNTCSQQENLTPHFNKILETVFSQLHSFMTNCEDESETKKKRELVFRPIFLCLLENHVTLNSLIKANEHFSTLVINEVIAWGCESQEIFKVLFLKLDFINQKLPWCVFKGIKDELKRLEKENLYLYVIKYFLDNFGDDEELCDYL